MGFPGMMLPQQPKPYQDDVGAQPMDITSLINALTNPSLNNSPTMGNSNFSQPQAGDLSVGGDPSTLSGRIQEYLGAKQPNQGGQIQDILAGRFQPPAPTFGDIGNSAIQTLQTGQYVPAQNAANSRLSSSFDTLDKLSKMQETGAQANYYNAVAANGGGRGEALALLNRLNSDPTTAGLDLATKLTMVKGGLGVGNTMVNGAVQPIQGNLQTVQQTAQSKETGTQNAMIAGAAPAAEQKEIGAARGAAETSLASMQANFPALTQVISDLHDLGKKATYTIAGQGLNSAVRQSGLPVGEGGVARAEYIAKVNNVLIPTLKAYFGPRVTNFDLQQAANLMADPNLSPDEKDAQLKAFITQKALSLQTQKQQVQNLGGQIPAQNDANINVNVNSGGRVVNFNDLPQ